MKAGFKTILFFFVLLPYILFGQAGMDGTHHDAPFTTPTISGSITPCIGTSGYVYTTEQFMNNYFWVVTGGTITDGGTSTDNSVTVTWNALGAQTVHVSYVDGLGVTFSVDLTVTVQPSLPVSISITPSATSVCAGTQVTFTATAVNGGSSPTFIWFVNGQDVGVSASIFSYPPINNDIVHCQVISNLACPSGNPASSAPVVMSVTSNFPVGVAISSSANPSCLGDMVTLTASPSNGGNLPLYQWKRNGVDIPSATNSTYSYIPVNGDVITCRVTSSMTCTSGNPAISVPMIMTVSPNQPVGLSIAASSNPVCSGNMVTFSTTAVNGGPAPVYTWKINGTITGGNDPVMTYSPVNYDVVTCILNSNAVCKTGNPAPSNAIIMAVLQHTAVSVDISASANPLCDGSQVTLTANSGNGGATPHYEWIVNNLTVGTDNPAYTYQPSNGDQVKCLLTSSLSCATGNPSTSNTITMIVSGTMAPSVSITASSYYTCEGTPIQFNANPLNGGTTPSFQWKVNGSEVAGATNAIYTYAPANNDKIVCRMTSNSLCSQGIPVLSNEITISISSGLPVSVAIAVSTNPICTGSSVVFTAIPVNGGPTPAYQWKVNGTPSGSNSATFNYTPVNGEVITCTLLSSLNCAINSSAVSNAITMNVAAALPVSVSITASANPSCMGQMVTFTATCLNGGASPFYEWLVNGVLVQSGANLTTFNYPPTNGNTFKCVVNSGLSCASGNPATSNTIVMTVNPNLPVSVTINTLNNPSCMGIPVTYVASTSTGGASSGYQWKVNCSNAGTSSATFTYVPANKDTIHCMLTSSFSCAINNPVSSDSIIQTVNPNVIPSVTISASATTVCTGTLVTYTATAINGGSAPIYKWKLNGNHTGPNSPVWQFTPMDGDQISCTVTSNMMCLVSPEVTSNTIVMVVGLSLPAGISISASANPFCQGANVLYTATPSNGGTNPVYQWLINGLPSGTGATHAYAPLDGDFITCQVTSSLACASPKPATSNAILMYRNDGTPVSVLIRASDNPVCPGDPVTLFTTPTNGGTAPAYQWKVNGVNGTGVSTGPTYPYIPANGDAVTCYLTSNAACASGNPAVSNQIIIGTTPYATDSIIISTATNPFCPGTSVIFTSAITNGGLNPLYQWKVNGADKPGATNSSYTYAPQNNDVVTCVMTSHASCITGTTESAAIIMTSSTPLPLGVQVSASENPVCQGKVVRYTATPANGGVAPEYEWRVNNIVKGSNNSVLIYIPTNADAITCKLKTSLVCASPLEVISDPINMVVSSSPVFSVSLEASSNPVCLGIPVTLTATPVNGGPTPIYRWRKNGQLVPGENGITYSYMPYNGDVVTVTMTSSASCASLNPAVSNSVAFVVNAEQPVSVAIEPSDNPFCQGSQVTYTAAPENGGPAPTYHWIVNGADWPGATNSTFLYSPASGDAIQCRLSSNQSCINGNPALSNTVVMIESAAVMTVGVSITLEGDTIRCAGTQVRYLATATNGGSQPRFQWKVNGINNGGNTILSYFDYYPNDNELITCTITSNLFCVPLPKTATSNAIRMHIIPLAPVSVSITASTDTCCVGQSVTLAAMPVNPGTGPLYRWYLNGAQKPEWGSGPIINYIPANGDKIKCRINSNADCRTGNNSYSPEITMYVSPLRTVSASITPSANPVCQGTRVTFTAVAENGGNAPQFLWKVNGIDQVGNASQFSYTPLNGDSVSCIVTSNATCVLDNMALSNKVAMGVSPLLPVSVYIAAPNDTVCEGMVTFNATPTNGGPSPAFQWKVNGSNTGTNNHLFTYSPMDGDVVSCALMSNYACIEEDTVISNSVTLHIIPSSPVSITISRSLIPPCQGDTVVYTANPVNGGTSPYYQWLVNGFFVGGNNPVFSYVPNSGDVIQCQLYSNVDCSTGNPALSNADVMSFSPVLLVSVSIICSANPACIGTPAVFTALPVNEGTLPVYQWKVNGAVVGGNMSQLIYNPVNGDVVECTLTSDIPCSINNPAPSNSIAMSVLPPQTTQLTISTPINTVCSNTHVTFTSAAVNPGSTPDYQWMVNGIVIPGASNAAYTYIPSDGDQVTCTLKSSISCIVVNPVSSNTIVMHVSSGFPVSISISASANPTCIGQVVTFTSTAVNGGLDPEYQWMVDGYKVGTESTYTYIPTSGQVVTCQITSGYECEPVPVISNPITMIVSTIQPVAVSVVCSSNPACLSTSVTYTATATNGGAVPSYQWILNGTNLFGATNATYSYVPNNNDIVQCKVVSSESCVLGFSAFSEPIVMIVAAYFPADVLIIASDNMVCVNTLVTYNATPVYGGPAPIYQWQVNGTDVAGATTTTYSYFPVNNDAVTCKMTSDLNLCTSNPVTSIPVNMIVLGIPVGVSIIANTPTTVCAGDSVLFTATPINGGPVPTYQWKVNGIQVGDNSPVFKYPPSDGDSVYCMLESNATCSTGSLATSNKVAMSVNPVFPVSVSIEANPSGPVCAGVTVIYTAVAQFGGANPVYQWQVNGVNVGSNNFTYTYQPAVGDIVTCTMISNITCAGTPVSSTLIVSSGGGPMVTYDCPRDLITATNAKPFKLHGGLPLGPGGYYSGAGVDSSTGIFDPLLAGPGSHTIKYTYPTAGNCIATDSMVIDTRASAPVNCGNPIHDVRDNNKSYPTVLIGTQCWFSKNLDYGIKRNFSDPQVDNCEDTKYCLNNLEANCTLYGALYQWDELMRHDPSPGAQGLCPPGWHVPTDAEWMVLFGYYGGQSIAGDSLKAQGAGNFNGLPGGVIYQNQVGSFSPPDFSAAIFWTSDQEGATRARSHGLNSAVGSVSDYHSGRSNGFSVRCLLD